MTWQVTCVKKLRKSRHVVCELNLFPGLLILHRLVIVVVVVIVIVVEARRSCVVRGFVFLHLYDLYRVQKLDGCAEREALVRCL